MPKISEQDLDRLERYLHAEERDDHTMPLDMVQIAPVPTHAMHFRNPRRSHSVSSFSLFLFFMTRSLLNPASLTTVERIWLPTPAFHPDDR